MRDEIFIAGLSLIVGIGMFCIGLVAGMGTATNYAKSQAIAEGVAEYRCTPEGKMTFHYLPCVHTNAVER